MWHGRPARDFCSEEHGRAAHATSYRVNSSITSKSLENDRGLAMN